MLIDTRYHQCKNLVFGGLSEKEYYERLHKEYGAGNCSLGDIAYKYGIPKTTIADKFRQFGLEVRTRGIPEAITRQKAANGRFKKEVCCGVKMLRKIYKIYQDNPEITVVDLAYQFDIKVPTLYRLFTKYGFRLDYSRKKKVSHKINRSTDNWSPKEQNILMNMIQDGEQTAMFVAEFDRTAKEIQKKIIELGVMYRLTPITKEPRECFAEI